MRSGETTLTEYPAEKAIVVSGQLETLNATIGMIRELGYDVVTVDSAAEALDLIQHDEHISLLFSDVIIPDMNGIALARAVRFISPGMQIILASECAAKIFEDDEVNPKEFGLITKPCSFTEVAKLCTSRPH